VSATHQHVSGAADDVIVGDDVAVGIPHKPCRRGRRAEQAGGAGRRGRQAGGAGGLGTLRDELHQLTVVKTSSKAGQQQAAGSRAGSGEPCYKRTQVQALAAAHLSPRPAGFRAC
jgi:hypothetical protein